ncbi:MAG: hypothetical protein ACRCUP_01305 [Mycoplasmatales bacterium]
MSKIIIKHDYLRSAKHIENSIRYAANEEKSIINDEHIKNSMNYNQAKEINVILSETGKTNLKHETKRLLESKNEIHRMIISLKKEDAEKKGFITISTFNNLLKENKNLLCEAYRIPIEDLAYNVCIHVDKEEHPHAHIHVWNKNDKRNTRTFLTNNSLKNLRKVIIKKVFANELREMYDKQTIALINVRNELENYMKNDEKFNTNKFSSSKYQYLKREEKEIIKQKLNDFTKTKSFNSYVSTMYEIQKYYGFTNSGIDNKEHVKNWRIDAVDRIIEGHDRNIKRILHNIILHGVDTTRKTELTSFELYQVQKDLKNYVKKKYDKLDIIKFSSSNFETLNVEEKNFIKKITDRFIARHEKYSVLFQKIKTPLELYNHSLSLLSTDTLKLKQESNELFENLKNEFRNLQRNKPLLNLSSGIYSELTSHEKQEIQNEVNEIISSELFSEYLDIEIELAMYYKPYAKVEEIENAILSPFLYANDTPTSFHQIAINERHGEITFLKAEEKIAYKQTVSELSKLIRKNNFAYKFTTNNIKQIDKAEKEILKTELKNNLDNSYTFYQLVDNKIKKAEVTGKDVINGSYISFKNAVEKHNYYNSAHNLNKYKEHFLNEFVSKNTFIQKVGLQIATENHAKNIGIELNEKYLSNYQQKGLIFDLLGLAGTISKGEEENSYIRSKNKTRKNKKNKKQIKKDQSMDMEF